MLPPARATGVREASGEETAGQVRSPAVRARRRLVDVDQAGSRRGPGALDMVESFFAALECELIVRSITAADMMEVSADQLK
jgi:hypothetical protein